MAKPNHSTCRFLLLWWLNVTLSSENTEWPLISNKRAGKNKTNKSNVFSLCPAVITQNLYSTKCSTHSPCCTIIKVKCNHWTFTYSHHFCMNSKAKQALFGNSDSSSTMRMKTFNWKDSPWPNKSSDKETALPTAAGNAQLWKAHLIKVHGYAQWNHKLENIIQ